MRFSRRMLAFGVIIFMVAAAPAAEDSGASERREEIVEPADGFTTEVLEAQVLLDRLMFSPGAIDGLMGTNVEHAIKTFQQAHGIKITGEIDDDTSTSLRRLSGVLEITQSYTISAEDWATAFITSVPKDMAAQAKLPALSYTTVTEMLSERFHCTPQLLAYLNPQATWTTGSIIMVPNVHPTWIGVKEAQLEKWIAATYPDAGSGALTPANEDQDEGNKDDDSKSEKKKKEERLGSKGEDDRWTSSGLQIKPKGKLTVTVTKDTTSMNLTDEQGRVVFHAPVTAGSEHDPLPLGEWEVNVVDRLPKFYYNPDLFWDAEASDEKAKIPPGPNNPVGVAWIDISKPHYGLHGTPNAEKIGYTQSHGCVRLTNWDVLRLADMVKEGTTVLFVEGLERGRGVGGEM